MFTGVTSLDFRKIRNLHQAVGIVDEQFVDVEQDFEEVAELHLVEPPVPIPENCLTTFRQTLEDSFSVVSKPNFPTKYSFE